MKTILSHANLIDCVEPKVRPDSAVLIENGRIRAILPSDEAGSVGGTQMIDLKGGDPVARPLGVHNHPAYPVLHEMAPPQPGNPFRPPRAAPLLRSAHF